MKTLSKILPFIAAIGLLIGLAGCGTLTKTGAYQGDQTLYTADVTITTSYDVLHGFVTFEYDNRALLASKPEVKHAADIVRAHAKEWIGSAIALREAYAANPTPENRKSLESALGILHAAVNDAMKYLVQQHPDPASAKP